MTKQTEALCGAIEIMERLHQPNGNSVQLAIQACKDALAETQEAKPPTILARLPNGATVSNVYEAYEAGFKEGKTETQEPVAVVGITPSGQIAITNPDGTFFDVSKHIGAKFYTKPPSREWVGLSDDERDLIVMISGHYYETLAKNIEAKLREKNG